ncbi:MAG: hypothetical protein QOH48_1032 [Actinomycetota bacterium]|nr:hypothetical protein [Actinomycetota bacterium]
MGRIRSGFKLLGQSWSVIKRDPELIAVIAVGFIAQVAIFLVLFFLAFSRAPHLADFRFPRFLWLYPIMFASGIVGSLAGATVIAAAVERLEGRDPSLRVAFALALKQLPKLLGWSLIAITVGLVIQLIAERLKLGGRLLALLAGVSWAAATSLIVPVLLYEDRPVLDSVGRSASLIKKRWGEGVTGYGSAAVALAVAVLPVTMVGAVITPFAPAVGITAMAIGFVGTVVVGGAIGQVFTAALYLFAADGVVAGPFDRLQLENQYQNRAERKKASPAVKVSRIAWSILILASVALRVLVWLLHR